MIVSSGLPSYLTRQQVRELFATSSNPRDRGLFSLAYAYGLRVGEIVLLNRDDIDLERGRIRIRRLRDGRSGERPIFRSLLPLLRQFLASRRGKGDALFTSLQGRLKKRRIQDSSASTLPRLTCHPAFGTSMSYATRPPSTCSTRAKTSTSHGTTWGTNQSSLR